MSPITPEAMREATSVAYHELKKHQLCEEKDGVISVFGGVYKFFIDKRKKLMWMESQHHYKDSKTFKISVTHKDWTGIFSFAREKVYNTMKKYLYDRGMESSGRKANEDFGVQCRIVISQAYRANKDKIARIVGGFLWKRYDPEIASLTIKAFGIAASSLDYSLVWNNKEEVEDTLKKAPGILPFWRNCIVEKLCKESGIHLGESFFLDYTKISLHFPDIIATTKSYLESDGLTPMAWRYLVKLPARSANKMSKWVGSTCLINWMAAIGVEPRFSLIRYMMVSQACSAVERTDDMTALMRAALTAAKKCRSGIRQFWGNQVSMVLDWFMDGERRHVEISPAFGGNLRGRTNQRVLDKNQRKADWAWFMRQQEEWHRTITERQKAKTNNEKWESALEEFKMKGYNIVPLIETHQLIDEGKAMHHCVGSYVRQCLDGSSRIFSIRKGEARVATLELSKNHWIRFETAKPEKLVWKVAQVRGVCNGDVPEEVKKLAESVANKYTKAVNKQVDDDIEVLQEA